MHHHVCARVCACRSRTGRGERKAGRQKQSRRKTLQRKAWLRLLQLFKVGVKPDSQTQISTKLAERSHMDAFRSKAHLEGQTVHKFGLRGWTNRDEASLSAKIKAAAWGCFLSALTKVQESHM